MKKLSIGHPEQYVSRAGFKLASVTKTLGLEFSSKVVLDVGSSTGGFSDYALQHGAAKVIAVEAGTNQMHPTLRTNPKVELHEKTDIRSFSKVEPWKVDIVLIDVSFISLRDVLPAVAKLVGTDAQIVAMVKPQFEASEKQTNRGVIKNDSIRREILKDFEKWSNRGFLIKAKADSEVAGTKGNVERFYLLQSKQEMA